ncbi:MAG: outer membrane lipoprotein carrier protein LolA [Desulfuromonadales bacterium]
MKRILLFVLLALPMTCGPATAKDTIGRNEVVQALENPFKGYGEAGSDPSGSKIADFQGTFSQTSNLVSLNREQRGTGRVWVKFDRSSSDGDPRTMFRWEYEQPTQQEIVSDGETMWVYLPENNQVILSDMDFSSQPQQEDPMAFLTGLGNLSRDFRIPEETPETDKEGNYIIELRPRKDSRLIERMTIVVDREAVAEYARNDSVGDNFPIHSSTVYDQSGNSTLIEFHDVRLNKDLSESLFSFTIPEQADVVRAEDAQMGF